MNNGQQLYLANRAVSDYPTDFLLWKDEWKKRENTIFPHLLRNLRVGANFVYDRQKREKQRTKGWGGGGGGATEGGGKRGGGGGVGGGGVGGLIQCWWNVKGAREN